VLFLLTLRIPFALFSQTLWLLGNVAVDAGAAAEFMSAGGAATLVHVILVFAESPRANPALMSLVALTSLAHHEAPALVAAGAVAAIARCLTVAAAEHSTVVEPACAALAQLLSAPEVTDEATLSQEVATSGVVHTLSSVLAQCLTDARDTDGGAGLRDASLTLYAAQALCTVLEFAGSQGPTASRASASGCAASEELMSQAAASGAGTVARALLAALTRHGRCMREDTMIDAAAVGMAAEAAGLGGECVSSVATGRGVVSQDDEALVAVLHRITDMLVAG
jgi:hypothetical protein